MIISKERPMIQNTKNTIYGLLRKTERYTKTDMVYLASGSFWLFLKTFLTVGIAFGLSIAFANFLPKETYGEYKYIFSIFGFLAIPTLMGMGTAVTKSVARGYEGTPVAAIKTKIYWGFLGSFASLSVALYYFTQENTRLAGAFCIIAVFLPFVDTFSMFNTILTGKKLFKISVLYETSIQAISAATIALALFLTDNILAIIASYFISYTLSRFIVFRIIVKRYVANNNIEKTAISYGMHLSAMEILSNISETVNSILLWHFAGAAPVAIYSFAKAIPSQISSALQRITTLAFPKFAVRQFKEIKESLIGKMLKMFVLMALIVVAYWITAPYVFAFFFPQYSDAIWYSQIYALTLLFFPQKFIGTAFQAHARTKALYVSTTIVPIIRLILTITLIPLFGIMGAIIAELCARGCNLILISYLFVRARE